MKKYKLEVFFNENGGHHEQVEGLTLNDVRMLISTLEQLKTHYVQIVLNAQKEFNLKKERSVL